MGAFLIWVGLLVTFLAAWITHLTACANKAIDGVIAAADRGEKK